MISSVTKVYATSGHTNWVGYLMVKDGINYHVPLDPANTDYQAIQEWIADGGTVIDNGGNQ